MPSRCPRPEVVRAAARRPGLVRRPGKHPTPPRNRPAEPHGPTPPGVRLPGPAQRHIAAHAPSLRPLVCRPVSSEREARGPKD